MAVCSWCHAEMSSAISCTVAALHRTGRRVEMIPFGSERRWRSSGDRCGDCGAVRGGWHHPGCDIAECPLCSRQLMSCGCRFDEDIDDIDDHDDLDDLDDDLDDLDDLDDDDVWEDSVAEPYGVDGNGCLVERAWLGGQPVIIHRDDVPESDITMVRGIRCTTALRTVIDVAPEVESAHLREMVTDCLERGLFTVEAAWRRLSQPDMAGRRGADMLRRVLPPAPR